MKYLNKVWENRDKLVEVHSLHSRYSTWQQKDKTVLFKKDLNGGAMSGEVTIILINGGIWQYRFYNPSVTDEPMYVSAQEFLNMIIKDSGLNL